MEQHHFDMLGYIIHTLLYQGEGGLLPHHLQLMLAIVYLEYEGQRQHYFHLFHEGPIQGLVGSWKFHPPLKYEHQDDLKSVHCIRTKQKF